MTNKNFNSTIKPNTPEEQVKVLSALISKSPVYFYYWNDQLTRMEVQKYVSAKLPDFSMNRFDVDGMLLRYKTPLYFNRGIIIGAISSVSTGYSGDTRPGAMINAWFELDGALCIEPVPGADVRWMGTEEEPAVLPGLEKPVDMKSQVRKIWKREQRKFVFSKTPCRTFQPYWSNPRGRHRTTPDYLELSNGFDTRRHKEYRALIRFDDCVAVSKYTIGREELVRWKLSPTSVSHGINKLKDVAVIKGHTFQIFWN